MRLTEGSCVAATACALALVASAVAPAPEAVFAATAEAAAGAEAAEIVMSEAEHNVFQRLHHQETRTRFLERFWASRDPNAWTAWNKRLQLAIAEFEDLGSEQARLFMRAGPPLFRMADICPTPVAAHEIWHYSEDGEHPVVFIAGAKGEFEIWQPGDWTRLLSGSTSASRQALLATCERGGELSATLEKSARPPTLSNLDSRNPNWVEDFLAETTLLPAGAETFDVALVELDYPAAVGDLTALVLTLDVPVSGTGPDSGPHEFRLTGEISSDRLEDEFHYLFTQSEGENQAQIRLTVRRHVAPGRHRLELKLHDRLRDRYAHATLDLDVPTVDQQESGWAQPGQQLFKLLAPPDTYLTGAHRFETLASGAGIAKVRFFLDGALVMTKNRPPFSVELDVGVVPKPRQVEAVAYASNGLEIARDQMAINSGPHRFAVRMVEPRRGATTASLTKLHAEVDTPLGEKLSHVDFFWNETFVARLYQPPFIQSVAPPPGRRSNYVRALAVLEDGHSADDLVVLNTGETSEAIEVDFVELYASVLDAEGAAVRGLTRGSFRVFEDGVEQELRRFETVDNLPINAAVVLDSSTSMAEEIREVEHAAAEFFERVLEPKDRAAVIVFSDTPELRVPLTNELDVLNSGLAGIEAEGETCLYDTLIYSLYYLAGLRGKRALILVSDGADSVSEFSFDDALEFARRSGIAIYTIGLGLEHRDVEEQSVLRKLARETGGGHFSIANARRLEGIYSQIEEELRSQYLLGYQSSQLESRSYREVRVEILGKGLEVKAAPGYYP